MTTDTLTLTDLITLSLARWRVLHGGVTVEDYHLIVAAARDIHVSTVTN